MKLFKTREGIIVQENNALYVLPQSDWDACINRSRLHRLLQQEISQLEPKPQLIHAISGGLLSPIGNQEIWASGVTYVRGRQARMVDSKDSGGSHCYARVYEAERPELFFKATAYRTVGHGGAVSIRKDSKWNVPEPELTLFICSEGSIEGYTIGNDVSSRDIEGANPLYLPQAKYSTASASIGPCLYVPEQRIDPDTNIRIEVISHAESIFFGEVSISRMKRSHEDLAGYLVKELQFPHGAYLMTGTGIVPPDDFTLTAGDEIRITIDEIGTLVNIVKT